MRTIIIFLNFKCMFNIIPLLDFAEFIKNYHFVSHITYLIILNVVFYSNLKCCKIYIIITVKLPLSLRLYHHRIIEIKIFFGLN